MSYSRKFIQVSAILASVLTFSSTSMAHFHYERFLNLDRRITQRIENLDLTLVQYKLQKQQIESKIMILGFKKSLSIRYRINAKEIAKIQAEIANLLAQRTVIENLIANHKPTDLKQYPGMSKTLAAWGEQSKSEYYKGINVDVEVPSYSKGNESNMMVLLQGTIAGDIYNIGFYYDGKNLDANGKPTRAFVIRRWIDAPPSAQANSQFPSLCSSNPNIEYFRGKVKISKNALVQKYCYSQASFMTQLVPVNDFVNKNSPSIEIFSELNWEPGKYSLSINNIGSDADGDWYSFDVKDSNQNSFNMGMLKFSNRNSQLISSVGASYSLQLSESEPVKVSKQSENVDFKYLVSNVVASNGLKISGRQMKVNERTGFYVFDSSQGKKGERPFEIVTVIPKSVAVTQAANK